MKILTWNINGIRATKTPLKSVLDSLDADIICLQETKVTRDQLDEPSAIVEGYNAYFSFSKARSGYSGVATFVRNSATPVKAEEGLTGLLGTAAPIGDYGDQDDFSDEELHLLDNEGRAVITQHKMKTSDGSKALLSVINVYCPRADPEREDRKTYKYRFYDILQTRAEALLKAGSHVIVLGDVNTSHRPIDTVDGEDKDFAKHKGRQWLDGFLVDSQKAPPTDPPPDLNTSTTEDNIKGQKFMDTFRFFYPDLTNAYTCWRTETGARATNYGTRIDYIFADVTLTRNGFTNCVIQPDVQGSDHCPVKATLKWDVIPAAKCPPLCTKFLPQFSGRQQKLSAFFGKSKTVSKSQSDSGNISENLSSSQESNEEKPQLKRSAPELNQPSKKKKSNKTAVKKQGSLLSFFAKPKSEPQESQNTSNTDTNDANASSVKSDHSEKSNTKSTEATDASKSDSTSTNPSQTAVKSNQSDSWKSLFKGPPPAPLCKGHKEPCLLRTVKKDSLNKGRQFYVCNRPEGHKSNPEARCDHFEWVEKKKKK